MAWSMTIETAMGTATALVAVIEQLMAVVFKEAIHCGPEQPKIQT